MLKISPEVSVGVATIRRAELAENETSMTAANDMAVRRALETAGVEFIDGMAVRCRRTAAQPAKGKKPSWTNALILILSALSG